jgi:hypothetical protein
MDGFVDLQAEKVKEEEQSGGIAVGSWAMSHEGGDSHSLPPPAQRRNYFADLPGTTTSSNPLCEVVCMETHCRV